ncbi:hypothetical protein KBC14_01745 [Candidatus Woesebacteria bacterium]|jgi:phenylacetic acid degradation operon negative regulatory protein|nr:hypothetical protein [Candidatus Woesebacteria bacterium]MBP6883095.1 hypothetical protein [Candidatus Woesebacteria bacterium]QQR63971.1 MAG: hypothetical protein IPH70_00310 [Candidatus Roizmanbacteria bacterium]
MAIKERRSKILLAFCLLGGKAAKSVSIDDVFLKIFDLSLNQKTKSTINALIKKGALLRDETKKDAYSLTDVGFVEVSRDFPYFRFFREDWDGVWRILSYEIPERRRELRDKLRREVASWGLGPWHRSFWLTPHPIIGDLKNLISGKEEQQYVQAFESSHVFGDREVLIEKVWGKVKLHEKYKDLFKQWHEVLSKDMDKLAKFSVIVNSYVDLIRVDPGLPKELLGKSWIGYEALDLFSEIKEILLSQG